LESPIATDILVYTIKKSNSPLLHAKIWRPTLIWEDGILATRTPTQPEKLNKKSPPILEKIKSDNFCKIPLFWSTGIFHLRRSPRGSVLAICAPNFSDIQWSAEVLWRFGIFVWTDHPQARWRRIDFIGRTPSGKPRLLPLVLRVFTAQSYGRPYVVTGRPLYLAAVVFSSPFFFFFPRPILSSRRLDVYHTSTHDVALVRI